MQIISSRAMSSLLLVALFALLGACGGGGSGNSSSGSTTTTPAAATLLLTGSTNVVSAATPAVLSATLKNGAGAVQPGVVVTFTTAGASFGTFFPAGATALTDASGIASVTLKPGTVSGADSVTATATVSGSVVTSNAFGYTSTGTTSGAVVTLTSSSSSISPITPATLSATVRDSTGALVSGALVKFATTDTGFGTFSPSGGTALTNASGVAQVSLIAGSSFGADTVTATATIAGVAVSSTPLGFSVTGTSSVSRISLTTSTSAISSSSPATLTATLIDASGTPVPSSVVTFTTGTTGTPTYGVFYPSSGTVLTNSSGVATISLNAGTLIGADTVTAKATVSGVTVTSSPVGFSVSAAPVTSTATSIQFNSATPTTVAIKGIGGLENSTVVFTVRDSNGNPLANQNVTFSPTVTAGGISFASTSATSAADGTVNAILQSGTVPTPIRVKAVLTSNPNITAVSSQLVISTALPHEDGFSVAASQLNIEAFQYDGVTTTLTARMADRYGNLVPEGTAVSFRTAGGVSQVQPSCTTTAGACSVIFTSAGLRPSDGRVVVLATAIGEESFVDLNGNGIYDAGETFKDLPEAFVNANENFTPLPARDPIRDPTEEFVDFNSNGVYDGPDGYFNGVLRAAGSVPAGTASTLNVRYLTTIVLSTSAANITIVPPTTAPPTPIRIDLTKCDNTIPFTAKPIDVKVTIGDLNGNSMAPGTAIAFTTTNGKITSVPTSITSLDTAVASPQTYTVSVASDATQDATTLVCTNATTIGEFRVSVTSPKGVVTTAAVPLND